MSRVIKSEESASLPLWSLTATRPANDAGVQPYRLSQMTPQRPAGAVNAPVAAGGAVRVAGSSGATAFSNPSQEIEEIRKQAFREGYAEGERSAAQKTTKQLKATLDSLASMVEELASFKPRLRSEAERELVDLSLVIARRVLRRELTVDPQTVLAIVRTCLDEYRRLEIHRLRVNPRDYENVARQLRADPTHSFEIVADPLVSPGGAVFQTNQGELDARIETQLEEIEHGLADL